MVYGDSEVLTSYDKISGLIKGGDDCESFPFDGCVAALCAAGETATDEGYLPS